MSKEQKIKTYLHHLGNEDYASTFTTFKYNPNISKQMNSSLTDFTELTDWNNKKHIQSTELPQMSPNNTQRLRKQIKAFNLTTYQSSLFPSKDKKLQPKQFLSPVVIKFSEKDIRGNGRKSKLFYHKILHKDNQRKPQQPQKLRYLLDRISQSQTSRYKEEVSLPRTERESGILRILKKREKIRLMKKQNNTQQMKVIRFKQ